MGLPHPGDPPPYFEAHLFVCCNRRADGHSRGSCAAAGSDVMIAEHDNPSDFDRFARVSAQAMRRLSADDAS